VKALSCVGEEPVEYREIEILKYQSGVPYVTIHSDGPMNPGNQYDISLSISHSKTTAMAVVLITRRADSGTGEGNGRSTGGI